jgi:exonuclease III
MFDNQPLTISCLNCNSLNMSQSAKWNQTLKICGITKLRSDIIFLSDVRMSNKNLISGHDVIKNLLLNNPYEKYNFIANSTQNKRGVAILFKYSLFAEILEQENSPDENILRIKARIKGTIINLISIYGPNRNDPQFFNMLRNIFDNGAGHPTLIAGDWNCTLSNSGINSNIDCFNMARIPNLTHSNKLIELCEEKDLSDPFRFLYPNRADYSYMPRSINNRNKSRLDFFIITDSLLDYVSECEISPNLQNKLFDHKAVTVSFNLKNTQTGNTGRPTISNKDLDDDLLEFLIHATVSETYLIHSETEMYGRYSRQDLLNNCGRIKFLIRDCGPPKHLIIGDDISVEDLQQREQKIVRLQILKANTDLTIIEQSILNCEPETFFETLLLNVKNEVVSHQVFMRKKKKAKI